MNLGEFSVPGRAVWPSCIPLPLLFPPSPTHPCLLPPSPQPPPASSCSFSPSPLLHSPSLSLSLSHLDPFRLVHPSLYFSALPFYLAVTPSLVNVGASSTWSPAECTICLISSCIRTYKSGQQISRFKVTGVLHAPYMDYRPRPRRAGKETHDRTACIAGEENREIGVDRHHERQV